MIKFLLIHIVIIINIVLSQPISPNDPIYLYLRQTFRTTHDLNLLVQPYPFDSDQFNGLFFSIPNKHVYLRFAPNIRISNKIPDLRFGTWLSGSWEHLSILAEPVLVNDFYGEDILGEIYSRAGFTGRFENAIIQYEFSNATFQFGRAPVWWGQSWESSIIQSGDSPPYDFVSAQLKFGSFQLGLLSGQLHSVQVDTLGRFKRFIGGKRLTYLSKSRRLILTIGDLILYSGVNRSIEWQYLNPLVPYFFADLEKGTEYFQGVDNDNTMIFFNGRYLIKNTLSTYFELLIDDFQMDIENRDEFPDAMAWKVGIDGVIDFPVPEVGFELEFTRISGNTYVTRGWYTNWEDRGIPIGYQYGPDCQSIFLLLDHWLTTDCLISFRYTYLEKGELTLNSEYDPYGKASDPFPSGNVKHYNYFNPYVIWHSNSSLLEVGWDGDLNNTANGTLYIKAQIILGMGFN